MYCSSEGMPALAFYIQGSEATCTYVIYHIAIAWVAVALIILWFAFLKLVPHERNGYSSPQFLYFFTAMLFGFEGIAICFILSTMAQEEDYAPSAPPQLPAMTPTAPEWPRIVQEDLLNEHTQRAE